MKFLTAIWRRYSVEMAGRLPIQFVKFCFVGVLNTLTTFCIYILLTRGIDFFFTHYLIAEAIAYFAGTIVSFALNRHWTFQKRPHFDVREIARFYASLLSGLLINLLVLYTLVERLHFYDIIAVALSLLFTIAWNFLWLKFWVFPSEREEEAR